MPEPTPARLQAVLKQGRVDAFESIKRAQEEADRVLAEADRRQRLMAASRIDDLAELRDAIDFDSRRIELAYLGVVQSLARGSKELVEHARATDWSPPAMPEGLEHTVEVRLRETRELTLRLRTGDLKRRRAERENRER